MVSRVETPDDVSGPGRPLFHDGQHRGLGSPKTRVLRGGSWNNQPDNARAAYRNRNTPDNRNNNNGFRVARSLSPASTLQKPGFPGGQSRCDHGRIGRAN